MGPCALEGMKHFLTFKSNFQGKDVGRPEKDQNFLVK